MEKWWIHEKAEKTEETWRKNSASVPGHSPKIPTKVMQDSTTAIESEDSI
jgi:hypothetical protein